MALLGGWSVLSLSLGASRGIELTDEAFYWLQLRYWQALDFQLSYFGAYLDGLFWLLQERIDLMRVFGAVLVMWSSAVLFWQLTRYLTWKCKALAPPAGWLLGLSALLGLTHYGFLWTLRGPSYNTLAFVGCAVGSAVLLSWLRRSERRALLALLYGLILGMVLFSKVTTAVLLVPLHLGIVLVHRRDWNWPDLLRLLGLAVLGVGINLGYVTLRDFDWWQALLNGLAFQTTMETRDQLLALRAVLWSWQREAPVTPLLAMVLALAVQGAMLRRSASRAAAVPMLCTVGILGVWMLITTQDRGGWLLLLGLTAMSVAMQLRRAPSRPGFTQLVVIAALMFGLPFAYSFGTNASLAEHTLMAAPIPLVGLLCGLWALQGFDRMSGAALTLGALMLALPVLAPTVLPWLHAEQTYRLRGALSDADMPLPGNARYRGASTDRQTAAALTQLSEVMAAAGFQPGQPMVEFTGGHPGVIDVLGGRPVGAAWLLGNYPGSSEAAAIVLARASQVALRRAWLLTSPDASRRIQGWENMLDKQLGQRCHQRVASLPFSPPSSARFDRPGQPIHLEIWKPLPVCEPGGVGAR